MLDKIGHHQGRIQDWELGVAQIDWINWKPGGYCISIFKIWLIIYTYLKYDILYNIIIKKIIWRNFRGWAGRGGGGGGGGGGGVGWGVEGWGGGGGGGWRGGGGGGWRGGGGGWGGGGRCAPSKSALDHFANDTFKYILQGQIVYRH